MSHLQNTTPGQAAPLVQVGPPLWKRLLCLLLAFQIGLPLPALAGTVAFSSIPLARASTPAAPNIMFILDDSGSMDRAYMPDSLAENGSLPDKFAYCWDTGDDDSGEVDREPDACQSRDVPYRTAEINGMYYNPAVTYSAGVTAAGVSMGDQTTFTAVKTDPYLSPGTTTDLLSYSDTQWCDSFGVCVTNTTNDGSGNYYRYPDGVYVYRGGTLTTNPHYYTILPSEHCTDELLNNCTASSTPTTILGTTYATPAKVRWCEYTGTTGTMDYTKVNYNNCQAKRVGAFQYPKYLGFTSPGGNPTSSYATIVIGPAVPVATDAIASVMVGATNLIPGVTLSGFSGANAKRDAARALAYWISNKNQGYIACSGSGTTSIGLSNVTNPPGCNRSVGSGGRFINIVPNPGGAPDDKVYIVPTTGVGSTTPATGAIYNSPPGLGTVPIPLVVAVPAVVAVTATGSITVGDSGSDRYVRISRVDIGGSTVFTGATLDETGGTNSAPERDSLADKVKSAINSGAGGYVATTAGNVVNISAPAVGATYNSQAITVYTSRTATGSITINDSGSDSPVRISKVDIGGTNIFTANKDANGGTNSLAEQNALAELVRAGINGVSGFTATTAANNVVTIVSPITNSANSSVTVTAAKAATGSITVNDSGSDAPVRISKVDIGGANIFTANKDASGGTNTVTERNDLAGLVSAGITGGSGGFTATTAANNVVTIFSPFTNTANNAVTVTTSKSSTGSITINDSGSDAPVRISKVDIGVANIFTANKDASGGTNTVTERNDLAGLVSAGITGGSGGFTATTAANNVVTIVSPLTNTANSAVTVTTSKAATGTISIALGTTPQPVRISNVSAGATPLMNTNVDAASGINSQAKLDAFATAVRNAIQTNAGTSAHGFTADVTVGVNPAVITITSSITNTGANVLTRTLSGGRRAAITLASPGTTAVSLTSVTDGGTQMISGPTSSSTSATTLASSLVSQITANGYSAMLNGTTGVFAYQPLGSASVATPSIVQSPLAAGASSASTTIFIGPSAGFGANQRVATIAIAGGGCAAADANMLASPPTNAASSASALATAIDGKDDGTAPTISTSGASIILTGPVGTSMTGCTVTVTKSVAGNANFALTANPAATAVNTTPIALSPTWSGGAPAIGTAASATAFATLAPTGVTQTGMSGGLSASTSAPFIGTVAMAGGLAATTTAPFIGTVAMAGGLAATTTAPFIGAVAMSGGLSASTTAPFISTVTMGGGVTPVPERLIATSVNGFQGAQDLLTSTRSNYATFARVNIVPGNNSYPYPGTAEKALSRSDCAGLTCTYTEEMTNFANWYAYYRTRLLTMKTAAGRAFKDIDGDFRVGFMTIHPNTTDYLKIDYFENTPTHGQTKLNQKTDWYAKFYSQNAGSGTPLRSALSVAGRIFAGKNPLNFTTTDDPVQYSCQQNFAILTTDGMWNTDSNSSAKRVDGSTDIGNTDNDLSTAARPYYDGNPGLCPSADSTDCNGIVDGSSTKYSSKNLLADVAYYYYNTDLRALSLGDPGYSTVCSATTARSGTNKFNSCCGQLKGGVYNDVCTNEVKGSGDDTAAWQHMTTFTVGLGVDGVLQYKDDYKTAATGDYSDIVAGRTITVNGTPVVANWPQVQQDHPTTADDLWHAAVNGHGTYYSARDPSSLSTGLASTLDSIKQLTGAGAAAATSNLEPQAGDNFAYVGSYTTLAWTGNLEARTIDIGTGTVSPAAIWCVEDVAAANVNGVDVPGCTGRLKLKVSAAADTRQIHMFDATDSGVGGNKLRDFTAGNLTPAEAAYFNNAQQGHVTTGLSQYGTFGAGKVANATTANLVNYLRGQSGYEDETANAAANNRLYRDRAVTFGDVIGSQPVYVKKPFFSYIDPGYTDFKTASAASSRDSTVYIGGNGGMLHALDALTGDERWAYVPSQMLPSLYRLADTGYSDNHRFYVDGSVAIGDVFDGTDWRTILIGGFNSGGRGYYALDITVPGSPKGLWEFSSAAKYAGDTSWDADVGYSLGNPVITKLSNGTWTVMFTSGYNNVSPGNGRGYLYVLDAISGSVVRKIEAVHKSGTVGDTTTPSNLGKISAWVDTPDIDNTARYVYAGDLLGNLWRFDPNLAQNTTDYVVANPKRLAILKDSSNVVQPITTRPELGLIGSAGRIVLVGTGKYLESSDVSNTQQQTIYGIADRYQEINGGVATTDGVIPDVRDTDYTVAQTMSLARTLTGKAVDLTSPLDFSGAVSLGKTNWLVDLPESRERVNVDPQLVSGTLLVASNVTSSSSCAAGGTSFINFMDYLTGGFVGSSSSPSETDTNTASSSRLGAIIVGFVVLKLSSGKAVNVTLADSPTPKNVGGATFGSDGQDGLFSNTRAGWRELPVE